ncbi:DUF6234 family protein [Streptomyces luomodiensis]|uniref:DUF6234 family protein n=1 Tax=Streptomyces luomodiensis TaxID=3026192 RepID=A0ABY9UZW2_9ACTN|nr:DUF6234 family protein [Streptomyces sp. SCA4-21]WNE97335.1 DUF6234 family protein [Streptomyces sp. SCA4-21]
MAERTPGGCGGCLLVGAELAALVLIFLGWCASHFSWDPQHVGDPIGAYLMMAAAVAVIAAGAAVAAAVRGASGIAWGQGAVVGLTLVVMLGANVVGKRTEEEDRRQACHAGLEASWCVDTP